MNVYVYVDKPDVVPRKIYTRRTQSMTLAKVSGGPTANSLSEVTGINLRQCALMCTGLYKCHSIDYQSTTETCKLNSDTADTVANRVAATSDNEHFTSEP